MYDVIVIGAGPGGSMLAYDLAVQGLDVLVLDREHLPRYKACGGGLTLKTIAALPFDATETYEVNAKGAYVDYAGKTSLRYPIDQEFARLVMRDQFDFFLAQKAVQAGAKLLAGVPVMRIQSNNGKVVIETSKGWMEGAFLAGADGVYSPTARAMGLLANRRTGVAIEAEVDVSPEVLASQGTFATFDFGALPNGYGWIFPKRDHLSIGVFHALPGKATTLRLYLNRFIQSQPRLRSCKMIRVKGHKIPLGGGFHQLHRDRVLLVGDAANLADPWLGEGIYSAVFSAHLASQVMVEQLRSPRPDLSRYTTAVQKYFGKQFRHARWLAGMIYRYPQVATILLTRSALLQFAVFKLIRGDLTFQQLNTLLLRQGVRILLDSLHREAHT